MEENFSMSEQSKLTSWSAPPEHIIGPGVLGHFGPHQIGEVQYLKPEDLIVWLRFDTIKLYEGSAVYIFKLYARLGIWEALRNINKGALVEVTKNGTHLEFE